MSLLPPDDVALEVMISSDVVDAKLESELPDTPSVVVLADEVENVLLAKLALLDEVVLTLEDELTAGPFVLVGSAGLSVVMGNWPEVEILYPNPPSDVNSATLPRGGLIAFLSFSFPEPPVNATEAL